MISRLIITVAIALFFTPAALIVAQEHPEHPKKTTEHPKKGAEHPKKGGAEKQVSTADISAGIKKNIDAESKKNGDGKFHVKHESQDLALDLIKVHDDRLQDLGEGNYFACVDMKGTDGKTYDIDFLRLALLIIRASSKARINSSSSIELNFQRSKEKPVSGYRWRRPIAFKRLRKRS